MPSLWLIIALLSCAFRGGENLTLALGLLPAILVRRLIHLPEVGGFKFLSWNIGLNLALGAMVLLFCGLILDRLKVRTKALGIGLILGMISGIALVTFFFGLEAARTSMAQAANKFDLNQPDRVAGLIVLCLAGGLYAGMFFSLAASVLIKPGPQPFEPRRQSLKGNP